jgi:hypothetical protein
MTTKLRCSEWIFGCVEFGLESNVAKEMQKERENNNNNNRWE